MGTLIQRGIKVLIVISFCVSSLYAEPLRKEISELDGEELKAFRNAIEEMKRRSKENSGDPLGYDFWADIHRQFCASSEGQIHFGADFLPWHRGYLFYFEKAIQTASHNSNIKLPYWDWTTQRGIPSPYSSEGNNPLFHTRANGVLLSNRAVNLTDAFDAHDFASFGGAGYSMPGGSSGLAGFMESTAHGQVHASVGGQGGDMSFLDTSARDPIFWAHHANIDRLWDEWLKKDKRNHNPKDKAWLERKYLFYDAGKPVSVTTEQILEKTKKQYQGPQSSQPHGVTPQETTQGIVSKVFIDSAIRRVLTDTAEIGDQPELRVVGFEVPTDVPIIVTISAGVESDGPNSDASLMEMTILPVRRQQNEPLLKINLPIPRRLLETQSPKGMRPWALTEPLPPVKVSVRNFFDSEQKNTSIPTSALGEVQLLVPDPNVKNK